MGNFFRDNEDLQYYFQPGNSGLDWRRLIELGWRGDGSIGPTEALELYEETAATIGQLVADSVAPYAAEIDREGVRLEKGEVVLPARLDAIFRQIKDLDLHGMCVPEELGGMGAPLMLYFLTAEVLARADVSVMAHHGFHGGMAAAMLLLSIEEGTTEFNPKTGAITKTRFAAEIREIVRGDAWGCMDITEPDTGSDMARISSKGEQDADGNWFVTGQKIFITSGHGKYHFVIARTEQDQNPDDPMSGLKGLSMFLVPTYEEKNGKRRQIVSIDRLEEKLGQHGSATAARTFERAPARLLGRRGDGFRYMLVLMNGARLGVGFESIGLCEAAHRAAARYASERKSMGKTLDQHEIIADYLDEMRTDIQALRALGVHGAFHHEMAMKLGLAAKLTVDNELLAKRRARQAKDHERIARRVTPLVKFLAAEKAVDMARRCLQIHGGNGYMRDYPAERLLRDSLVMPIYEGTSQIQALMATKDTLNGILKNPQGFVRKLAQTRWRSMSSRDTLERRVAKVQLISLGAQQLILARTAGEKVRGLSDKPISSWPAQLFRSWDPKRDFAFALLHAERLTHLLAHEAICEVLLEQSRRDPERREVLERVLERAEPTCRALHDAIASTGGRLLRTLAPTTDAVKSA